MTILNEILQQLVVIFSATSFVLAAFLSPLNPYAKRLGFTLLLPAAFIGFGSYFASTLDMNQMSVLALLGTAILLLVLTISRTTFQTDQQMLLAVILFTGLGAFVISQVQETLADMNNSQVFSILGIVIYLMTVFLLYRQKKSRDWMWLSFFFVAMLGLSYRDIGQLDTGAYALMTAGAVLFMRSILTDYNFLQSLDNEERTRIMEEFDEEVEKEVRRRTFHIERSKKHVIEKSRTDNLTKALTKKALLDFMEECIHDKRIRKFSILMFDIDKFKTLNDTYGHITGDNCLRQLVQIAMNTLRDEDAIGRYGGDEFFIVLPDQHAREAKIVADRYRERIMKNTSPPYTISIGIASYPWDGESVKKLIEVADQGLYKSKEQGRNNVSYTGYLNIDAKFKDDEDQEVDKE